MTSLVVLRERELASQDQYKSGVRTFLGPELFRERWLSVHRKGKYLGYTGFTIEKTFAADAVEIWQNMDSRVEVETLGEVRLTGNLVCDQDLRPNTLSLDLRFSGQDARITGRREGERFVVKVKVGPLPLPGIDLPLEELNLGDALTPALPIAGFKVGEKLSVPCFDPLTRTRERAEVLVAAREVRDFDGLPVDVFRLETVFRGIKSRTWVNEAGEVLLQELGPPFQDYSLRRTTRARIQQLEKK